MSWLQEPFDFLLELFILEGAKNNIRRTHTNRVPFTETTLEGFIDQSQGDRS